MKAELQSASAALLGLRLWSSGRASDLQWFSFGEQRTITTMKGTTSQVGEFALHVQCPWRIVRADVLVVGSRDLYAPADEEAPVPDEFKYDGVVTRRDKRMAELFADDTVLTVRAIDVGEAGALGIALDSGHILELFPNDSTLGEDWRLFRPYRDDPHLVISGGTIEPDDD
jgi:hypothetical protein